MGLPGVPLTVFGGAFLDVPGVVLGFPELPGTVPVATGTLAAHREERFVSDRARQAEALSTLLTEGLHHKGNAVMSKHTWHMVPLIRQLLHRDLQQPHLASRSA